MSPELKELHLIAGIKAGERRTCGQKVRYGSEESAVKAAEAMNTKPNTRKILEAYPCGFCSQWHIGRVMSLEELKEAAK